MLSRFASLTRELSEAQISDVVLYKRYVIICDYLVSLLSSGGYSLLWLPYVCVSIRVTHRSSSIFYIIYNIHDLVSN